MPSVISSPTGGKARQHAKHQKRTAVWHALLWRDAFVVRLHGFRHGPCAIAIRARYFCGVYHS
eukprot:scaffold184_cov316-Pinguiococcus_pyrenoidosus.AAC.20